MSDGRPALVAAPAVVAAGLAFAYVIISPPSVDLAAHLSRAKLFSVQGFGIWNNWWYAGHHIPAYSVLFPPVAAALSPQLAGAIAATGTAVLFAVLAHDTVGPDAWLGASWFGLGAAANLYSGRLSFAFGLLPAAGGLLALTRRHAVSAAALGAITALCSPVAALFAALAGAAHAVAGTGTGGDAGTGAHSLRAAVPGLVFAVACLLPAGALAAAFPEGGTEPFPLGTLAPILVICAATFVLAPREQRALRAGSALYGALCLLAYLIPSALGSNAARLGPLLAGPLAALLWWRRRTMLLAAVAVPLLYLQCHAAVRDVSAVSGEETTSAAYYRPLLGFLATRRGPPFRIEIPFTRSHWEAYEVGPRFPLARGWERQLDVKDNRLFYGDRLTAAAYDRWLHALAVEFVALPDSRLDYSAIRERRLIDGGLRCLRPVFSSRHWRVFAVVAPTPIVTGAATLQTLGPSRLTLHASRPGTAIARVRYTPYWRLDHGCVVADGDFTKLTFERAGRATLEPVFALDRIGSRARRCN